MIGLVFSRPSCASAWPPALDQAVEKFLAIVEWLHVDLPVEAVGAVDRMSEQAGDTKLPPI